MTCRSPVGFVQCRYSFSTVLIRLAAETGRHLLRHSHSNLCLPLEQSFQRVATPGIISKLSLFELCSSALFAMFLLYLRRSVVGSTEFQMHGRLHERWLGSSNHVVEVVFSKRL